MNQNQISEENLDPQDWEATRALGHKMLDDMFDYLQTVGDRPIWQPIPDEVKELLAQPTPIEGLGEQEVYEIFKENILPHGMGNTHPRFWGWVMGNGIPYAILADLMANTMNPNMGGGEHVPNYVERQVLDWCKEWVGFPPDASGLMVSGGSMANFVGLAVARNTKAGYDVRNEGLAGAEKQMVFYASSETHSSNYKAVELFGIGKENMRFIPVNDEYQIDITALEAQISADKAAGMQPICIIGHAGTVNTGAFDDLEALADIALRENMWFHVDGAFGALAHVPANTRGLTKGMPRADSVAFDLHKWMYFPFEAAVVLIKNLDDHMNTFAVNPNYLAHMPRGVAGGEHAWFGDMGVQLTRSFKALKVWMTIKAYGIEKFANAIEQNIAQAKYLEALVEEHPALELLAPVPLNIVCYRYVRNDLNDEQLNVLNREILMELHERGLAVPSYTTLHGKFAIRVANTNHRSTLADFDYLVAQTIALAEELA